MQNSAVVDPYVAPGLALITADLFHKIKSQINTSSDFMRSEQHDDHMTQREEDGDGPGRIHPALEYKGRLTLLASRMTGEVY